MDNIISNGSEEEIISTETGRFSCRNCNQSRSSISLLRRHVQKSCKGTRYNHQNGEIIVSKKKNIIHQPDVTYKNVEKVSIETGRFQCKNCDQTRSSESLLQGV